jgi:predicted nucleic acid-binding protein
VKWLLDADVLIGALDSSDAHHARARRLLTEWRRRQDAVQISVVNLSEDHKVLNAAEDEGLDTA